MIRAYILVGVCGIAAIVGSGLIAWVSWLLGSTLTETLGQFKNKE